MRDTFEDMRAFEFCRFKHVVSTNKITNVICFQQEAWDQIIRRVGSADATYIQDSKINVMKYPICQIVLGDKLSNPTLYQAKSTRLIRSRESNQLLKDIICAIKANSENSS